MIADPAALADERLVPQDDGPPDVEAVGVEGGPQAAPQQHLLISPLRERINVPVAGLDARQYAQPAFWQPHLSLACGSEPLKQPWRLWQPPPRAVGFASTPQLWWNSSLVGGLANDQEQSHDRPRAAVRAGRPRPSAQTTVIALQI